MIYRLPAARPGFGLAYLLLAASGGLTWFYPSESMTTAVGTLVYVWSVLYVVGGVISGLGIIFRNYLLEWPGLIFLIGANVTLVVAITAFMIRTEGSFVGVFILGLATALVSVLSMRLHNALTFIKRADALETKG